MEIHSELQKGHYFKDLNVSPDAEIEFCKCIVLQTIEETGITIIQQGDEGEKCFVVLSGSMSVETQDAGRIRTLKGSDAYGMQVLQNHAKYTETLVAQDVPLVLLAVSRRDYDRRMGPCKARDLETKEREFRSISAFMDWSAESIRHLANETSIKRFAVGQELTHEGQLASCSALMIIIRGFCEVSKASDEGQQGFGTLTLGDTLGLEHLLREEAMSFTATAGSIVDVMVIEMAKIQQPHDGPKKEDFAPLIDDKTLSKLLERERKPPTTAEYLQKVKDNDKRWDQYKKQLVSGLVWDRRYTKFTSGSNFNKYVKMDMARREDLAVLEAPGDHHYTLTSHISPAVLPPSVQSTVGKHEHLVLDNVLMGRWMTDAHEADIQLNEKYYKRGRSPTSPESPLSPRMQKPTRPFEDWPLPNSKVRNHMESNPVQSLSGPITPSYEALQSRWQQIRGQEYRLPAARAKSSINAGHTRKHVHDCKSAPRELEQRPSRAASRQNKQKHRNTGNSENSSEAGGYTNQPWIPVGYHRGGVLPKDSPFASPSYPVADWSRRGEQWILKPKAQVVAERAPSPKWVPPGTHRITTSMTWDERTRRFQRTPLRQWSILDPSEEAISISHDPLRPSTAPRGGGASLNSSLSLSKDFGGINHRPQTAVCHSRPWSPGGALLKVDAFSCPNTKFAYE